MHSDLGWEAFLEVDIKTGEPAYIQLDLKSRQSQGAMEAVYGFGNNGLGNSVSSLNIRAVDLLQDSGDPERWPLARTFEISYPFSITVHSKL